MEKIAQLIKDYRWMKNEINRLQSIILGSSTPMRSWGIALYGIEAAMPRGSKGKSHAEMDAMDIREKNQLDRLEKYERNVYALEKALDILEDERQKIIYYCLLDDMTHRQIAEHLSMSKGYVRHQKKNIISQISQMTAILQSDKRLVYT